MLLLLNVTLNSNLSVPVDRFFVIFAFACVATCIEVWDLSILYNLNYIRNDNHLAKPNAMSTLKFTPTRKHQQQRKMESNVIHKLSLTQYSNIHTASECNKAVAILFGLDNSVFWFDNHMPNPCNTHVFIHL